MSRALASSTPAPSAGESTSCYPSHRTIVADCGQATEYPLEQIRILETQSALWMCEFGAIGCSLGAALGAAVARPERATALFIGDGALLMCLGDLDTAVRERIPLVVVCLNDRSYGPEVAHLHKLGLATERARFDTPDLAVVARSIGFEVAATINELAELDQVASEIATVDRPIFLNCLISEHAVDSPLSAYV